MKDFQPDIPRRVELWQSVLETLRMAIVRGNLPPGTRLVEAELSEKMNVSRGPVRDALMHLEREGLVESLPRRGVVVAGVSERSVREIYGLRTVLEAMAARLAAARATAEAVERLRACTREMRELLVHGQRHLIGGTDMEFHRQLVTMADHRRLLTAWEGLAGTLEALVSVANTVYTNMPRAVDAHDAIADALAAHDAAAAEQLVRRHIEDGEQLMLSTIRSTVLTT